MWEKWQASINILCALRNDKTVLVDCEHNGPLTVQKVFYPEKTCHMYLLHPPGGIAGCDELNVRLEVAPGAKVLLTTPGATKYYRTQVDLQAISIQKFWVKKQSELEILPQANIYFTGTNTKVFTEIHLENGAKLFFRDISVCGSIAQKADFAESYFTNQISIYRHINNQTSREQLQFHETTRVNGNKDLFSKAVLNGCQCIGMVLATPANAEDLLLVRNILSTEQIIYGASLLGDILVIRLLSQNNEDLENMTVKLWQCLRPTIFGKEPVLPRVWAT